MDSNHRRRTPADLQSAPFGHSGNFPLSCAPSRNRLAATSSGPPRVGLRADGGIRTHDQLITNQLLWPTELHRQYPPFWIAKVGIKNLSTKLFGINFPLFLTLLKEPRPTAFASRAKSGAKLGKLLNNTTICAKNITTSAHKPHTASRSIRSFSPIPSDTYI